MNFRKMNVRFLSLLAFTTLLIAACTQEDATLVEMTDAELIAAIQQAEKQNVEATVLPDDAHAVLDQEFSADRNERTLLAPELGYEVRLRRARGVRMGERSEVYFNLEGRRLRGDRDRPGDRERDRRGDRREECFELIFPVTFTLPDGSTVTGENEEQLWQNIREWYQAHPDVAARPELQFPVDVVFEDGTELTLENEHQLERVLHRCRDKVDRSPCFELIYPVSYMMPDGSTITGDNREEVRGAIGAWYEAHPDVAARPELQFPVEVLLQNGSQLTLESKAQFHRLQKRCRKRLVDDRPCFRLTYPLTYIMPDGSTISGDNREEIRGAISAWYEAHPDVAARPELQFPVEITYEDGTTQTLNSKEEMHQAIEDCG